MAEREESGKLGWFVAGAVLGGAVALLYAPKSGKETRDFINKKKVGENRASMHRKGILAQIEDIGTNGQERQLFLELIDATKQGDPASSARWRYTSV